MVRISQVEYFRDRKKVFDILKNHPSLTVKDIAHDFGFSISKVYKIKREYFNRKKSDLPYFQSFNDSLRHFIVLLSVKTSLENVENYLRGTNHNILGSLDVSINFSYVANGTSDLVLGISCEDMSNVKIFCKQIKKIFHESIIDVKIVEILKPIRIFDEKII